jgi:ABC-type transport system involved in cytochrome c biogenesis permease component
MLRSLRIEMRAKDIALRILLVVMYLVFVLPAAVAARLRGKQLPQRQHWRRISISSHDPAVYRGQY